MHRKDQRTTVEASAIHRLVQMVRERGSTLFQTSFIRVQLSQRDSDRAISVHRYNIVGTFKRFEYCDKDKLRIIETEVVDNHQRDEIERIFQFARNILLVGVPDS